MIYDPPIVLYIIISFAAVGIALVLLGLLRSQKAKDWWLKFLASMSFLIHISYLWYEYLTYGYAIALGTMLFPIYFCNLNMILLVVVAFIKDKQSKVFKVLSEFLLYAGTFGAIIATLFSEFYNANPNLFDYYVFKSLLSHTFLLAGCLWLGVGGYVKVRVKNTISFLIGIMICIFDGFMINLIYEMSGIGDVNAMYLNSGPLSSVPWLTSYFIVACLVVLIFAFTSLYEQLALKKEDRWYSKISDWVKQRRK